MPNQTALNYITMTNLSGKKSLGYYGRRCRHPVNFPDSRQRRGPSSDSFFLALCMHVEMSFYFEKVTCTCPICILTWRVVWLLLDLVDSARRR